MKKILILFGIVIFVQTLITFTIPENWITHRVIENVRAEHKSLFLSSFYPYQNITMNEVGDLGHHTKYQIQRNNITWITDKYGFRNSQYIKNPDYVFIGASFVFGGALSQDEILSEIFNKKSTKTAYNLAPHNFNQFLERLNNERISKPKSLLYFSIERNIPNFKRIPNNRKVSAMDRFKSPFLLNIITPFDKVSKLNYQKYLVSRMMNSKGQGLHYGGKMLFLQGKEVESKSNYSQVMTHAEILKSYSDTCDSLGIEFIFIPIPNKETIYYQRAGLASQPTYLKLLNSELIKRKVKTVNLLEIFNNKRDSILLYHLDDTHWNSNSTNIAVDQLIKYTNAQQ